MSGEGEKTGLAAAVAICLDEQEELRDQAEQESMSDLFGEVVPSRGPGRPAGAPNRATQQEVEAIRRSGQSPLAFLASIWRDKNKPLERRIQSAIAALPYVHKKLPVDLNVSAEGFAVIVGDGAAAGEAAAEAASDVLEGTFEEVDDGAPASEKDQVKSEG